MAKLAIRIQTNDSENPFSRPADKFGSMQRLYRFLESCVKGTRYPAGVTMDVESGATFATATVVFSGASGTVGCVLAGVTFTAAHGASDAADATALAAAINASTNANIKNIFTAALTASETVTVTCLLPGINGMAIAASGTGVTIGGSAVTLAGATKTQTRYSF